MWRPSSDVIVAAALLKAYQDDSVETGDFFANFLNFFDVYR